MQIKIVPIESVKTNDNNPRFIKDAKFKQLVKSIKSFPKMLELRPVVVDSNMVSLGGNMRLKAAIEAGLKTIPIIEASELSESQKKEFIIKDNLSFGEWDYDILANEWNETDLIDWGMDLPTMPQNEEAEYTTEINIPKYEPKRECPELSDLVDVSKCIKMVEKIKNSNIDENIKSFLIKSAQRHNVFNYENIAEFYAHQTKDVQELMEESALVIIDFKKAIEMGYVKLSKDIENQFNEDYEE